MTTQGHNSAAYGQELRSDDTWFLRPEYLTLREYLPKPNRLDGQDGTGVAPEDYERLDRIIASDVPKAAKTLAKAVLHLLANGASINRIPDLDIIRTVEISLSSIKRYKPYITGRASQLPGKQIICPADLRRRTRVAFDHTCQYCREYASPEEDPSAMDVDCIVPKSKGGRYVPENVTLACRTCNGRKGDRDAPEGVLSLADIERCGGDHV